MFTGSQQAPLETAWKSPDERAFDGLETGSHEGANVVAKVALKLMQASEEVQASGRVGEVGGFPGIAF